MGLRPSDADAPEGSDPRPGGVALKGKAASRSALVSKTSAIRKAAWPRRRRKKEEAAAGDKGSKDPDMQESALLAWTRESLSKDCWLNTLDLGDPRDYCPEELLEVNAVGMGEEYHADGMSQITIDSGAAVSVIPKGFASEFPVHKDEHTGKRHFRAADGGRIADLGVQKVDVTTSTGDKRVMTFRVANVTKPLCAVSQVCAKGNRVIFDSAGSYIEHKATGKRTPLREQNGVYVLDVWLAGERPWQTGPFGGPGM